MLNDIYTPEILTCAAQISKIGRLNNPNASAEKHSRLCGSRIIVDLTMEGDTIIEFGQVIQACALGQAAASLVASHIIGMSSLQFKSLQTHIFAMLSEGAPLPKGFFEDFAILAPITAYPQRHASAMLCLDAVVDCIEQIEKYPHEKT
ncbi:iron-sulfur cluster assembly scaffold protein [Bartonella sp. DGB2]|uniref:iron-sulfur cluster assembly scaffold protein n=1 Tax=Bartonella sp. DGB2 TaxID=3388426 RepID=UPI0039902B8A